MLWFKANKGKTKNLNLFNKELVEIFLFCIK